MTASPRKPKPAQPSTPAPLPRRRGAALEDALLAAAWDVLVEHSYQGFTYEAVAARAGTSRPVLYRRWPQRGDLLLAALARHLQQHRIEVPDTGSLRGDALGLLRNANVERARTTAMVLAQLMDFFRETGTSLVAVRDQLGMDGGSPFDTIVARAVARGELPDVPRSRRLLDLPLDLLRHDVFTTLRAVPDAALVEIVDDVWLPLLDGSARGVGRG